jgi:hypothetical protein
VYDSFVPIHRRVIEKVFVNAGLAERAERV